MIELDTLAPKIQTFFTDMAEEQASSNEFVKRRSKLNGSLFLQTLVFGFLDKPEASLSELVETSNDLGVSITKQGLQARIENAVPFLKAQFQKAFELFRNDIPLEVKTLQQFSAIFISDSSTIALPAELETEFPGCGGDGPAAALKIQLTFELLCGVFTHVTFQAGRSPDQVYQDDLIKLKPGALYLTDLGYFTLARFRTIAKQSAYFLSRLDLQTALYHANGEPIDLLPWLSAHSETQFEAAVLIGSQERLPGRLVVRRVPQEVADARRRKAIKNAQRKGRTPSERYLALLAWTIFITNVPASLLTIQQVIVLYAVRWQIELVFKLWKSTCALDRVAGWHRPRVLSELYAKLIGIVLMQFLVAPSRLGARELSVVKAAHIIQHSIPHLIKCLGQLDQLTLVLQDLAARFRKNGLKDARRKRLTTLQEIVALEGALA